jgi:hypothetical protein
MDQMDLTTIMVGITMETGMIMIIMAVITRDLMITTGITMDPILDLLVLGDLTIMATGITMDPILVLLPVLPVHLDPILLALLVLGDLLLLDLGDRLLLDHGDRLLLDHGDLLLLDLGDLLLLDLMITTGTTKVHLDPILVLGNLAIVLGLTVLLDF